MINLSHYIKETFNSIDFNEINESLICETLKDPKLLELATALKKCGSKNKDQWCNFSFSGIFGRFNVAWDKITEQDWIEITDVKKAQKEIGKIVTDSTERYISGIALIKHEDKIRYMITYTNVWDFYNQETKYDYIDGEYRTIKKHKPSTINWVKRQADKKSFMKEGDTCYILHLDKYEKEVNQKKGERYHRKNGIVLQGDAEYYRQLAQSNVERYKKIIAKNKAEKTAKEDTLSERVQELINKTLELSTEISKGGAKYADLEYTIGSIIESIYSQQSYNQYSKKYTGSWGVLYLYNNYLKSSLSVAKNGGYNYERDSIDKYKAALEKKLDRLEEDIKKLEEKMEAH